ncbi:MAG: hypothetical protein SPE59_01350 [Treponema sp.]|nr:hypothetical protein [Treponema sp.]
MVGKPDVYILTGENGKKAYDHICNAQPLEHPQYSDDERAEFNIKFSKLIPEIIENWNKLNLFSCISQ